MKGLLTALAAGLLLAQVAAADTGAGRQLLARYVAALQGHDRATLEALLAPDARIEVLWLDATPAQHFTLSRAEYLQQLRATWRFGSAEKYEFGPITWTPEPTTGALLASFRANESRLLFGSASGQRNDLVVRVAPVAGSWRITGIQARTQMW